MADQQEQQVEGNQTNIGELHGNVEQVGDRVDTGGGAYVDGGVRVGGDFVGRDQYNEIIINLNSFAEVPPAILQVLQTAVGSEEDLREDFETSVWEPETILIPAGPFTMGCEPGTAAARAEEMPSFTWELPAYRIGRTPVTNEQYAHFIGETERKVSPVLHWQKGGRPGPEQAQKPVAGVSWYDALAYCLWLARETGRPYTLPDEAQWEKAARGSEGRLFPWGEEWADGTQCNDDSEAIADVDAYEGGKSPYGCLDMVGNVREWTISVWGEKRRQPEARYAYPWPALDPQRTALKANSQLRRVTRGGAPLPRARGVVLRATRRGSELPLRYGLARSRVGFRVALNLA